MMTNEELKKKICEIIAPYVSAWGEDERIADALIAAGLKFDTVISHTATFDLMQQERINELESENAALRERLDKAATFALDMCSEDECAGDSSVGLPPCPMWHDWDTDGNGTNFESGCYLKEYLAELKGGKNE